MSPQSIPTPSALPLSAPFAQAFPIHSLADVQRLEQKPLAQALTVRSTYEIFRNAAHAFGDKTALSFLPDADPACPPLRWTYAELLAKLHQTANLLHRLGVQAGDAVAVLLPGCLEYHLALWGGEAAGIVQPLNPLLSEDKLVALMNAGRAKVLIAWGTDDDTHMAAKALHISTQVPTLRCLLQVRPAGSQADLPTGVLDFHTELAKEAADQLVSGRQIAPEDIAAYFHTGGTTGAPKLARHSHGAQVFTAWASVQLQGIGPQDVTINGYPLFHVAGVLPGALAALSAGAETLIPTTTLFRNKDIIRHYWRLVERYRVTVLSAVPTVLSALANVPLDGADISSLRFGRTGAAPLPPELSARFEKLFGLHVHESFGMTETVGIATITPPGVTGPAGCVGWRMPYAQIRIVALDEQGGASQRDLPPGEQGMVLIKAPNLFSGFLDPKDNANAFTADGWLATGDLGWVDTQGRLNLSGRSKDLIIRGGHNIDPKTIEDALGAHPAVQLCAAVGAPDAYAGELPVVYATLLPGAQVSEAELLAFVAERVDEAPAKPKHITVIPTMPMTNVGKIYKPELRLLAIQAVVIALADKVYTDAGCAHLPRPQVLADATEGVRLVFDPAMVGAQAAQLRPLLQEALARLPVKTNFTEV